MSIRKGIKCPFYEEHAGEYYQGYWEHDDLCYLGQDVKELSCYCTFDGYGCWFYTGNPILIIKQINEAFKGEYERTIWNRKEYRWELKICKGADGSRRYNLKKNLDLILKTLNELDEGISFYA